MDQDKHEIIKKTEDNDTLLSHIDSPDDLRNLDVSQLPQVCREIRDTLIRYLSVNPGHFGSSMGAVDIIVALHYVFNTPHDRILYDVGHQAYAHKLLTGRREAFATQRTLGGISGFPSPSESIYDTFTCGHAGNAISAALGMAIADMNTPGQEDRMTVALIGDASIGNGLAFEGLNNTSINPNNLLIILNDNDMSISPNVGALHRYFSELTTSVGYNKWRYKLYNMFRRKGMMDDNKKGVILRFGNALKSLISRQQNIFEGLNIRYFGPFDGNDVTKLVKVLNEIKGMHGPRILHLHTVKGQGYEPAMKNPADWHAPGKFDPATGARRKSSGSDPKWQEVFGNHLLALARANANVVSVTAAMAAGTSVDILQKAMPDRVYDVGISEGHAVTFAGGLAAAGKHPFAAIYSSFLQRAYDNIIHDTAINNLPVTLCIDRAGLVGEDGVTHHGMMDIAFLLSIPNYTVAAPADADTLRLLMNTALKHRGPMAIRYPRGNCEPGTLPDSDIESILTIGKGRHILMSDNADIAILSLGNTLRNAVAAAKMAAEKNVPVDVYDMIWAKPFDTELVRQIALTHKRIITVEDGVRIGGFGSAVRQWLDDNGIMIHFTQLGIPDRFIEHGSVPELEKICGLDPDSILNAILS
jgi:1-deoxy-D-xylulose-5-phosphate synthase